MNGKIRRTLGLALVAIAALIALGASTAQAGSFDIGVQPAIITGHSETPQNNRFNFAETDGGQGTVSCTTHSLEGTTQGLQDVTEITVTTTKGGQCLFNGIAATVRMNGCKDTLTGAGQAATTFLLDIVGCTNGTTGITISVPGCQLRIPEQNGISHVVGTNQSNDPHTVTLDTTATGITVHQAGLACPDGNGHKGTSGSSQGEMILKAFEENQSEQVTNHLHQYDTLTHGVQVNLTAT